LDVEKKIWSAFIVFFEGTELSCLVYQSSSHLLAEKFV